MNEAPVPEPQLDAEERSGFEKAVGEFNSGFYFECHDTLEEVWCGLRGPSRDFFQGLIQVSVGFYHLGRGNLSGAESMFARALKRFAPYPARYFGFELGAYRAALEAWLERIRAGGPVELRLDDVPKWRFENR